MSVPNESAIVRTLFDTGLFDLTAHGYQGAFTDCVVSILHAKDPKWGHLKKSASQTHVHRHGEDSALYLVEGDGASCAVDFIGGAGGPNPQPGWMVDSPRYSKKDWADPTEHGFSDPVAPQPVPALPKGEAFARLKNLDRMYRELLLRPEGIGGDMEAIAQWFYQIVLEGKTDAEIEAQLKASDEYRAKHP